MVVTKHRNVKKNYDFDEEPDMEEEKLKELFFKIFPDIANRQALHKESFFEFMCEQLIQVNQSPYLKHFTETNLIGMVKHQSYPWKHDVTLSMKQFAKQVSTKHFITMQHKQTRLL